MSYYSNNITLCNAGNEKPSAQITKEAALSEFSMQAPPPYFAASGMK